MEGLIFGFLRYLAYEILHRPESWQCVLYIHLLSFPRFYTFCIEWFAFIFLIA